MVITRFAPSPTGYLHIGGARTALFNYLFSKHHSGKFLLRIEDTDQERSTTEAKEAILRSMAWLKLDYDGNVVYQSERVKRHQEAVGELLRSGGAYYCFSSKEEIEQKRQEAIDQGKSFLFKSPWRDADPETYPTDVKPVVRLKSEISGSTTFHDLVQGEITVGNEHIDDMVLLRGDGTPTYMLAVVVDDHDMGVTHIIRGDDHLTNATRQIAIYKAFGWDVPAMAHIPLIYGPDGAKLSKRHGAVGVEWYKDAGYLPEALCNYLLRLGWSHGNDEIISRKQAIEWFDLLHVGKSPSRMDFDKLRSVNAHYIKHSDDKALFEMVMSDLEAAYDKALVQKSSDLILRAISQIKVRAYLVGDLVDMAKTYIVGLEVRMNEEATQIVQTTDKGLLEDIVALLASLESDAVIIQDALKSFVKDKGLKMPEVMQPLRALITGTLSSPSISEIIAIIGMDEAISRIRSNCQQK